MGERVMMKGNEAIAEGAIRAGCRFFFGYPITPQNEIPEYMSRRMPKIDGVFIQAESEISAINMVYGAGGAGGRVMTSSSSPGISLKQEGISYIATAEVPCVIVNVARGGPGLGGLTPSQADYFQSTKGGGHGDYHLIVLAPWSVQEMVDLVGLAFDLSDKYRNPAMILADSILGQMMEPVSFDKEPVDPSTLPSKPWATTGNSGGRAANLINSLGLVGENLEAMNRGLQKKYQTITENEVRWETYDLEDADLVVIAYGTTSRVAKSAIDQARKNGKKVGLFRPISLWPFPTRQIQDLAAAGKKFLVAEMSMGQMIEDVRLAVNGAAPIDFFGKLNGGVPTVNDIYQAIMK